MGATEPAATLSATAALRLVGLGALVGVPAALVAAGFVALVHELEVWLWHDLPERLDASSPPWYLVLGIPLVGAVVVVAARRLLPGDGGHEPLDGIGGGATPVANAPGIALAAIGSLAFGAVLGPEAPLIALGSATALAIASGARLGDRERAVVSTAGSFSAISALFGGPLVAAMLLLESGIGLGAALIPALIPGLVAAAIGYLVFVGFGDWGGHRPDRARRPRPARIRRCPRRRPRASRSPSASRRRFSSASSGASRAEVAGRGRDASACRRSCSSAVLRSVALALLADALGADSQDVLFSGQQSVPGLVQEDSARVVLVLVAAKALAYGICLGCGFRGGPVFPAIFLGVGLAMLCVLAFDVSPTLAVAVGTAAGTVAATGLLFSAVLFASRPRRDRLRRRSSRPPSLAAVAAWLTRAAMSRAAERRVV